MKFLELPKSLFEEYKESILTLKSQCLEERDLVIRFEALQEDIYFSSMLTLEKFILYYEMCILPMDDTQYEEYFKFKFGKELEDSLKDLVGWTHKE